MLADIAADLRKKNTVFLDSDDKVKQYALLTFDAGLPLPPPLPSIQHYEAYACMFRIHFHRQLDERHLRSSVAPNSI
jgi:hypothetical protein